LKKLSEITLTTSRVTVRTNVESSKDALNALAMGKKKALEC